MRTVLALDTPLLAPLLENRVETLAILGAGVLQVGLHLAGLPGWACPFKAAFGIPCPGCGLTLATDLLLHGQVRAALGVHAFAPLFVLAFALLAGISLLPTGRRQSAIDMVRLFEQHTAFSAILLIGLLLYWGLRLARVL